MVARTVDVLLEVMGQKSEICCFIQPSCLDTLLLGMECDLNQAQKPGLGKQNHALSPGLIALDILGYSYTT